MQWDDEAIVIGARLFGEHALIVDVLTRERGRRAGLVHGGASRGRRATFEAGNTVKVAWEAKQEDALGRFSVAETVRERASYVLEDATRLAALASVSAILREALQDGDTHGGLYDATLVLLDEIAEGEIWPAVYIQWELGVLSALGYGLDLKKCAISGANDGLTHVSPRTGRAVKGSEAEDYLDKLLVLPGFLAGRGGEPPAGDIGAGLRLTGWFLERRLFHDVHKGLPPARGRMIERLLSDGLVVFQDGSGAGQ